MIEQKDFQTFTSELRVIAVESQAVNNLALDQVIAETRRLLSDSGSYKVSKFFARDIENLYESLIAFQPTEQATSIKECIVICASTFSSLFNPEENNNAHLLEELLRTIKLREISLLLLVEEGQEQIADQILELSHTLLIEVEGILVGTPSILLSRRLLNFVEIANHKQELLEQQNIVEETNNHLIREQEIAKAVFEKVTGEHRVDLPNVRQWLSPIAVFNGDVFMSSPTPNNGLLVLLGDFTGHGLGASLGAIPLAATFYRMANKGFTLRDIVVEMNRRLNESLPTGFFCCALAAHINFEQETVEYINAGLPDCYWLKNKTGELKPLVSKALPLGIQQPDQFDIETTRVKVSDADRLFMLSDGLLETENRYGEAFGTHRLVKCVNNEYLTAKRAGTAANYLPAMREAVKDFIEGQDRFDDISLAEVEIVPAQIFANSFNNTNAVEEAQKPSSWSIQLSYGAASIKNKDPIPQVLNLLLDEPGLKNNTGSIFTIVSEIYNNALDHGVLQLDSSLKAGPAGFTAFYEQRNRYLEHLDDGQISFDISYEAVAETGSLTIIMTDSGNGFDWRAHEKASLATAANGPAPHGRGLPLLRELCDSLTFSGKGNSVKAIFSWDKSAQRASIPQDLSAA